MRLPSPFRATPFALPVVIAAVVAGTGCKQEIPLPPPATRADASITLPATPNLTEKPYAKFHPDGVLTVEGIMRNRDEFLGKTMMVRGVVTKLVQCPTPPAPEPDPDAGPVDDDVVVPPPLPPRLCDPPPQAYLVDKEKVSRRELLVYGSMRSAIKDFQEGAEVTVEGRFDIVSKDGVFLRQAGMLVLEDLAPPEPPPAEGDAVEPGPTE
ncbi:MAG: hypothetical protein EP329_20880 [Deltaproteobacteria bacterium]|nr:MAG: hypothetical protein EP329_20880 [Deltaproteobacteria bacterium]